MEVRSGTERLRCRVWQIVEAAAAGDRGSRTFDAVILTLIFLNVVAVMVDSVRAVHERWEGPLFAFEVASVAVFTVEYLARLWSCTADPRFAGAVRGRLRFALRPLPLVDLLAILPFFLPFSGFDLRSIRALRLVRLVRLAKVARYYESLRLIRNVFRSSREELVLTSLLMAVLLVVSSTLLFYCENGAQPEVFSSIPATMWWSVATLTTVGYGDMYPVTHAGRFFASLIAILGIGMFALPTGILGAGFVGEIERSRKTASTADPRDPCRHCGRRGG